MTSPDREAFWRLEMAYWTGLRLNQPKTGANVLADWAEKQDLRLFKQERRKRRRSPR